MYLVSIIVLLVAVFILVLIVVLLCWRRKRHKKQERDRRTKAMQAMFQQDTRRINLSKRPKSVNLEYRGGNPLHMDRINRLDYRPPVNHKFSMYDETEGLLTAKSKCSDGDSAIVHPGVNDSLRKEKDDLLKPNATNNLNEFHSTSMEDNYNISCGSENTLTKPYLESSNDLMGDMDRLSEFDNAACIGSSCSDFAVNKSGRPPSTCSDTVEMPQTTPPPYAQSCDTPQCPNINTDMSNVLDRETATETVHAPTVTNIPIRGSHQPADKHMRYSINDDVWLRNSSNQSEKAPMGDKCIRYSVGADNTTSTTGQVHLGVPPVCDSTSYRKSL